MFHINPLKLYPGAVGDSMTDVWGSGRAALPIGLRFRDAFLGTVAAGALAFGGPALAGPDACTIDGTGTIETCSGDQSAGIAASPPVTTLNVNNLNQAIAPAIGTAGINFFSPAGAITITSNTGAFGITTANGRGIYANGSLVVVTSTGNIVTTGGNEIGIFALSGVSATVTSTGNISSTGNAIDVRS
jgi:hypothetical protein